MCTETLLSEDKSKAIMNCDKLCDSLLPFMDKNNQPCTFVVSIVFAHFLPKIWSFIIK